MAKRAAKRPFGSVAAQISREALWWNERQNWPSELAAANRKLAYQWQKSLTAWAYEAPEAFTPSAWGLMRQCASSVYWSPALVSKEGKPPRARFCYQRWLCPFCYGREIVKFLRPFENERIHVHGYQVGCWSFEEAWAISESQTKEFLSRHGAVACWRQVLASAMPFTSEIRSYNLWAVWIMPGFGSLDSYANKLIESLAYPVLTLDDFPWWTVKPAADWMRTHKGRVWAGKYHGLSKRNEIL